MKNISQIEKNIEASFSYVKKDILMLNDAFAELNDKLQRVLSENEDLRKRIEKLEKAKKTKKRK